MPNSPWLNALLLLALTGMLAVAWHFYGTPLLISELPRHLRVLPPVYYDNKPATLDAPGLIERAALALAVALGSIGALLACSRLPRGRWATVLQLTVAVAGVLATNASIAHIRGKQPGSGYFARPTDSFTRPFARPRLEYFYDIRRVGDDPIAFARNYPRLHPILSHHARTHPPGGVLFLWAGHRIFNKTPDLSFAAWWAVGFTALGVLPAYWLARAIPVANAARLLPLYLAAPNLILYGATSMDGVFLVFTLTSLASAFWALRRPAILNILLAGLCFWLAAFMTYAAIAVPVLLFAYVAITRFRGIRGLRNAPIVAINIILLFIALQLLAQRLTDYDFLATAQAAMDRDLVGLNRESRFENVTKYLQLSLANPAAFLFASGLAATASYLLAIITKPTRFSVAFTLTVIALAISTLFTLETERVWLFLTPPLLLAALPTLKRRLPYLLIIALLLAQAFWTELRYDTLW